MLDWLRISEVKRQNNGAIVFYRVGDFYETFERDAEIVSDKLELILVSRDFGEYGRKSMCGLPAETIDQYIKKLTDENLKVALVESLISDNIPAIKEKTELYNDLDVNGEVDIFNTDKKYSIIYADPPWQFEVWSRETGLGRSAEAHYPTMHKQEIQKLPVQSICEKNSVLLLWVTAPCLLAGIELINAWGFRYKTVAFTWVKQCKVSDNIFMGMGYYTRANAEFCLLATRGKILERKSRSVSSVIISHVEKHSKKPDTTRKRIVELFGDLPRIELFSRDCAAGWDSWGNEVGKREKETKSGNLKQMKRESEQLNLFTRLEREYMLYDFDPEYEEDLNNVCF
jgi:N6-adenosine-specific RNA methylase IME4